MSNIAIFCDFDGTIARADIGYHLFTHFTQGRNKELLPDWIAGRITSRQILTKQAEMVEADEDEILAFIDQYNIDPTFKSMISRCKEKGIPVTVVSEGMDLYIERLLAREGLTDLPIISNRGILKDNRITIDFPHRNETCTACGSCKGERIEEFKASHPEINQIIFIGDGYSDACAVTRADIVFAKKDLRTYCLENHITYNEYENFDDVTESLENSGYL